MLQVPNVAKDEGLQTLHINGTHVEEALQEKDQHDNGQKIKQHINGTHVEEALQQQQQQQEVEVEEEIQEVIDPVYVSTISPVVASRYTQPLSSLEIKVSMERTGSTYAMGDFTFRDTNENLLFVISPRNRKTQNHRVLLDSAYVPVLSAHRKARSLYNRWDVFRGEVPKAEEALFSVKRSTYLQLKKSFHVFLASSKEKTPQFKVKGNYVKRNCKVFHGSEIIAEVKGQFDTNLQLKKNTFSIVVHPGVDYAFVVTLIVIMDEIHREQDYHSNSSSR